MSENKKYLTPDGAWWTQYFESSQEEQAEAMFNVAVGIMWSDGQLDREGWTGKQRERMEALTAEAGPALASIDYKNLTPEEFKKKTDEFGVTEQVLEMQDIWQKVARAKETLDTMLNSQGNGGEENASK